jgi:hypothetical protein
VDCELKAPIRHMFIGRGNLFCLPGFIKINLKYLVCMVAWVRLVDLFNTPRTLPNFKVNFQIVLKYWLYGTLKWFWSFLLRFGLVKFDLIHPSPLKVNWCFLRTCNLHLQGRKISQARNQCESRWQALLCLPSAFTLVSCLAYFSTLKMEAICSSET